MWYLYVRKRKEKTHETYYLFLFGVACNADWWKDLYDCSPEEGLLYAHSLDSLPDGFLKTICPQLESIDFPASSQEMSESFSPVEVDLQAIAENADPDISNPAVLYVEDYNIVLVSSSVVARIARGDKWLLHKVVHWTESFEDAFVVVANFGFFIYNNR